MTFGLPLAEQTEGEPTLFNELYIKYYDVVFNIALEVLHNEADAKEVVDTVMLSVANNIAKFIDVDEVSIKNQIVAYAKNSAINIYRQNRRRGNAESPLDENITNNINIDDKDNALDDIIMENEISETVRSAISKLPQDYQDVINLVYIEGYTYKEAAEILKMTTDAVGVMLTRAKKKLKEIGGDELYELYKSF